MRRTPGHADLLLTRRIQFAQFAIEVGRAEEKATVQNPAMAQLAPLDIGQQRCPGIRGIGIIGQLATRDGQGVPRHQSGRIEDTPVAQFLQVTFFQVAGNEPLGATVAEQPVVYRTADVAAVQAQLQRQVVVHLALDHALLHQVHHAVDEHLGGHVEPLVEGFAVACYRDVLVGDRAQGLAIVGVVLLPENAGIGDGITQRSNADLQGAAVGYQ